MLKSHDEEVSVTGGQFMPQIVKSGKHVFDWSKVSSIGKIVIPDEAKEEYNLTTCNKAILMPGSKRSGEFSLTTKELLKNSRLHALLDSCPEIAEFQEPEGRAGEINGKTFCWVKLN